MFKGISLHNGVRKFEHKRIDAVIEFVLNNTHLAMNNVTMWLPLFTELPRPLPPPHRVASLPVSPSTSIHVLEIFTM